MPDYKLLYIKNPLFLSESNEPPYKMNPEAVIVIEWLDLAGKFHRDIFRRTWEEGKRQNGEFPNVHYWDKPEEGARDFLSHCPIHNVEVKVANWDDFFPLEK